MTEVLINGLCILGAFTFMEFWAWFSHKYIMHGFLWKLHKDHHFKNTEKGKAHFFEKNDFFFLIFAIPAMALIFVGLMNSLFFLVSIGLGITLYGAIYFIIHDVIIHRRLRFPALQKKRNHYIRAVLKAHAAHHIEEGNNKYISFGLLLFPKRFLKS